MGSIITRILVMTALAAGLPGMAPVTPGKGELTVNVTGTDAGLGAVRVNLYGSAEGFLEQEDAQIAVDVPQTGAPVLVFRGLVPGDYAVVAYYDLNGNGRLDRGLFGVPLEPLGFSNGVVPVLSRPDFAEAAFAVEAGRQGIRIDLRDFAPRASAGS